MPKRYFTSQTPFARYLEAKFNELNAKALAMDGKPLLMADFMAMIRVRPTTGTAYSKLGHRPIPEVESRIRNILDSNPEVRRVTKTSFRSITPFGLYLKAKFGELNTKMLADEGKPLPIKDFAAMLKVSPTSLSGWITQGYTPKKETLKRVVTRLGGDAETAAALLREEDTFHRSRQPRVKTEVHDADLD